eukprot:TRINITY_DN12616_c1_g1_i1.p1 TRINITY_DN12616_c1_g1~~TRINITY_DN12616_c1_g1_i1.p1  ORF type:complete len:195 (+),score=24.17 TRINITY_DN12616_c1_g1_i1:145-729(+)
MGVAKRVLDLDGEDVDIVPGLDAPEAPIYDCGVPRCPACPGAGAANSGCFMETAVKSDEECASCWRAISGDDDCNQHCIDCQKLACSRCSTPVYATRETQRRCLDCAVYRRSKDQYASDPKRLRQSYDVGGMGNQAPLSPRGDDNLCGKDSEIETPLRLTRPRRSNTQEIETPPRLSRLRGSTPTLAAVLTKKV